MTDKAKLKWYKTLKGHMQYNHFHELMELSGINFLDYKFRVETLHIYMTLALNTVIHPTRSQL